MNTNAKRTVMRLVAGVAAVATLMGTAACGSSNSSSSDDNTLTVSYWDDEMQPIKDFIKANPDIKVKQIRVPGDDYNTKLNQMIVGGTAPDVMLTQEADYVRFAKNGVTMKLDDKLKDLGIDKSDFQPAVTDIANQVDGYYGFPQGFATEIMYYNKDMFDAAGVAYPTDDWTWDDYTAAAEKLTKADGSQYGSDSPTFNGVWYSLIGAAGDKVVDNGKLSFGNGLKKTLAGIEIARIPVLRQVVRVYIELSRNTPLLVQLYFLYFGLPKLGLVWSAELCAIVGLGFLGGSYMAEAMRGGLETIPEVQRESAYVLGLSKWQTLSRVVIPQAISTSIPGVVANVIFLIKESSVVSAIALADVMYMAKDLIGMYYDTYESLFLLIVAYLVILLPISLFGTWLERRFDYERR